MISVVYACNDKMFDGLYLSILSILRRCKEIFRFYLLTADYQELNKEYIPLTPEHIEIIDNLVKKYNAKNKFTVIDVKAKFAKTLIKFNKNPCTIYANFYLLLDQLNCFTDKIIYLDVDTMACGNIKTLNNLDVKDNDFLVCHNKRRCFHNKNNYNSGVILFNMDAIRSNKTLERARQLLVDRRFNISKKVLYLASKQFTSFPDDEYRFNRQTGGVNSNDIIRHFAGHKHSFSRHANIKSWNSKAVQRVLKINAFDEDYRIYHKMKEEFQAGLRDRYFILVSHLRKNYGSLKAVDDISFKVKKGSLFAFLGVNGAGKSTTINIISSTLGKDSGDISIDGYDLIKDNDKVKEEIGIVFQYSSLDSILTVRENLVIRAHFYGLRKEKLEAALARVSKMLNLEPILNQPVGKLSGGQRRRVDIARALIHEPKLLMLDEPTTGLDPKTRIDVWHLIDEVRQRTGMTVFLTTHYLEEAEKASYVEIMDKGKIIAEGTPNELKNQYASDTLIAYLKPDTAFEKKIKKYKYSYDDDAKAYNITIKDSATAKAILKQCDRFIKDFEIKKGNMDSVFLNVTRGNK